MILDLKATLAAEPDNRGEYHAKCPFCGKEPKRGTTHFSFSENGYKCFVCGQGGSLKSLAHSLSVIPSQQIVIPRKIKKRPVRADWKNWGYKEYEKRFFEYGDIYHYWGQYKPLTRKQIDDNCLGYGILPNSSCHHARLVVPIWDRKTNRLLCLRGRKINCDCPQKWTVSAGFNLDRMPIFNYQNVNDGDLLFVVENPIDAIMATVNEKMIMLALPQLRPEMIKRLIEDRTAVSAVASLSVSYWKKHWNRTLKRAGQIIVAYDNDLPGNGNWRYYKYWVNEWKKEKGNKPPIPNGTKLVNRLRQSKINAVLLDWGERPQKYDIGDYLDD